ncbi:hypothetical protein [Nonomuraea cavernae]|uniref:CHRD domain-containing protein n=1 Tax=Nonomuraea cavernae TaxID=2045107 RepID=A0A917YQN0_9ACTN|nr:hypothetical protein [Nonomuraea cavernae]MCA2183789.1 hypothetical protein [Nonomuraea cavernae]GGO61365.1 hypothetical protein GCM10012289_03430 [Nonomuraea cavernae]
MRTRLPAALLLLLSMFALVGGHSADAAGHGKAVSAPIGVWQNDFAFGGLIPDDGVPRMHAHTGGHAVAGAIAVLPVTSWHARDLRSVPAGLVGEVLPSQPGHRVAPARAPPSTTL